MRQRDHFTDLQLLGKALDQLCPEQLCDAVYADWLLQLNSPPHLALLQVRELLLHRGALAANYLAELAQNADDACNGREGEVRIRLEDDWLLVSNNGRKLTSLDLLGLSRFFVHASDQVVALSAETIGRFGIGFKSSYRMASEVFVRTWDSESNPFCFRLPICREEDAASHPDPRRLEAIVLRLLATQGAAFKGAHVSRLGYCTPEFLAELPPDLEHRTINLRTTDRGTLFCFHVRPDRLDDVRHAVEGEADKVYQLCPLFLRSIRLVQLGQHELVMKVTPHELTNDLTGTASAVKVELTTQSPGQKPSPSRFWRLEDADPPRLWQVAIHADRHHRLRIEKDEEGGEQGVALKDGAAYAFFPLNALKAGSWPFRFHLHLKLPTNLSRDNWNSEDAAKVEEQLRQAVRSTAAWVDARFDSMAGAKWSFEKLIESRPAQMRDNEDWAAKWANIVFEELKCVVADKAVMRSLGGRRVCATGSLCVAVSKSQAAEKAWAMLAVTPELGEAFPSFVSENGGLWRRGSQPG